MNYYRQLNCIVILVFFILIMNQKTIYAEEILDFENGLGHWRVSVNGNVHNQISESKYYKGAKSYQFGPSTCGINCFDSYTVSLIREFNEPIFISTITAWVFEEGNWGGKGYLIINGNKIDSPNLSNVSNTEVPIKEWVKKEWEINMNVDSILFYFRDLTDQNPMYIDEIEISFKSLCSVDDNCYLEGYQEGKNYCIENPDQCGLYTEEDMINMVNTLLQWDVNNDKQIGLIETIHILRDLTGVKNNK